MSKSIVKACVRYNDRLYTGFDHGECFKKLNEDNKIEQATFTKIVHSEIEQGFVDSDGNFVDRKQAMIIVKEAGQLTYENDKQTLISEDLHLNWLNKQAERIAELEEQLKKYEDLLGITKQEPLCYLSTLEKLKVTEEALTRILRICGTGDCEIKNKFIIEQFEKLKEDLDLLNTFISENAVGVWVDVNEVKDKINNRIQLLKAD